MLLKKLTLFVLLLSSLSVFSQNGRYQQPLFQEGGAWPNSGWLFSAGVTYPLGLSEDTYSETILENTAPNDTSFSAFANPAGQFGIGAEIGRFHRIIGGLVFHQFDYSIGFRQFKYGQDNQGFLKNALNGDTLQTEIYSTKHYQNNLSLNLNFNTIFRISAGTFFMTSIGASASYDLAPSASYSTEQNLDNFREPTPWNGYVVAKLGFGMRLNPELFFIPTLEVYPLHVNNMDLSCLKWGAHNLNSQYLPLVLSFKFLLHRPINFLPCTTVEEADLNKKRHKKKVKLF